jgi:hypothetical protein
MRRPRFFLNAILGVVIGASACAGTPTAPGEQTAPAYSLDGLVSAVLLSCSPLPASSTSVVVGSEGGIVSVGPHTLVIPPGALSAPVAITGEVVTGSVNSVRFSPSGLQFAKGATLVMSYRNCSGLGMLLPKKIVYTDELLNLLDVLRSLDLSSQKLVSAQIGHFSRYAVAY